MQQFRPVLLPLLQMQSLVFKEVTAVFEVHGVSVPCTELPSFNYANVNSSFLFCSTFKNYNLEPN